MNMEDRLREAFDQEAQNLHAPSGSPDTAIRRGRRRRASNLVGGAALVLALVGGTAAGVQLLGDSEDPPEQDLASATETVQESNTTEDRELDIESVDFAWQRVELPLPTDTVVWNVKLKATDDGFLAIGRGDVTSPDAAGSAIVVWRSNDGRAWELVSAANPFDGFVDDVMVTDDGLIAVVRADGSANFTLHSSTDGVTWTEGTVTSAVIGPENYLWLSRAASGDGVSVVAGVAQEEPGSPSIILEEYGVALDPPTRTSDTFTVRDLATGEVISEIPAETIYGGVGGELVIQSAEGETIMAVLEEEIFGQQAVAEDPGFVEMEQDGTRLTLDYNNNRYRAVDTDGNTLAEGTIDELYRTDRILITDQASGEVIVDISFEEFIEAEERSYDNYDYSSVSTPVILSSTNGVTWVPADLPIGPAEELDFTGLAYGSEGFLLTVGRFGSEIYSLETWRSADGSAWQMLSADESLLRRQGSVTGHDADYYALTFDRRGSAGIERSDNGDDWSFVFEADTAAFYLNEIVAGELGLVAIGQQSQATIPVEPIIISKEGRTFVLDSEAGTVSVTEDATGERLLDFAFDVFSAEPPPQFEVDDDTGDVTIRNDAGEILMTITEAEGEAASESTWEESEFEVPVPVVLFSPNGADWRAATTAGLDLAWSQSVAVGADAIVIAGESASAFAEPVPPSVESGSVEAPASTLLVEGEFDPSVYLWVGQPK